MAVPISPSDQNQSDLGRSRGLAQLSGAGEATSRFSCFRVTIPIATEQGDPESGSDQRPQQRHAVAVGPADEQHIALAFFGAGSLLGRLRMMVLGVVPEREVLNVPAPSRLQVGEIRRPGREEHVIREERLPEPAAGKRWVPGVVGKVVEAANPQLSKGLQRFPPQRDQPCGEQPFWSEALAGARARAARTRQSMADSDPTSAS